MDRRERNAVLDTSLLSNIAIHIPNNDKKAQNSRKVRIFGKTALTLTRPTVKEFRDQLDRVMSSAHLRMDRLEEINVQIGDITSFFGSLIYLQGHSTKWTLELIDAVLRLCSAIEFPLKMQFDCPRPITFDNRVQPIIQTPTHGTWPSGHATEAFALATVLSALTGNEDWVSAKDGLFRLAGRIADNRTVAGVHFPTDSYAGAFLGVTIGQYVVACCTGKDESLEKRSYQIGDENWQDFIPSEIATLLRDNANNWSGELEKVDPVLGQLWKKAKQETDLS